MYYSYEKRNYGEAREIITGQYFTNLSKAFVEHPRYNISEFHFHPDLTETEREFSFVVNDIAQSQVKLKVLCGNPFRATYGENYHTEFLHPFQPVYLRNQWCFGSDFNIGLNDRVSGINFGTFSTDDSQHYQEFVLQDPLVAQHLMLVIDWSSCMNHKIERDDFAQLLGKYRLFSFTPDASSKNEVYYIIPMGLHLPIAHPSCVDNLVLEEFRQHAQGYREKLARRLYDGTFVANRISQIARQNQSNATCVQEAEPAGLDHTQTPEAAVKLPSYSDLSITFQTRDVSAEARATYAPLFQRFGESVEALYGVMHLGSKYVELQFPRDKFNESQKLMRKTGYSYSPAGLNAFISDLKAEEAAATDCQKAIDAALALMDGGTADTKLDCSGLP